MSGYRLLILISKKEGVSFDDFKAKYEEQTALVREIAGAAAPVSYTRRYVAQNPEGKPLVIVGGSVDFDAIVELEFNGQEGFAAFAAATSSEEAQAKIKAGEDAIVDSGKTKLVVVGAVESGK